MPAPEPSKSAAPVPVCVVVGSWLPFSETFVYEQLRFQERTRAWVIAGSATKYAARFPYEPTTHLGLAEQLGFRYLGVAPSVTATLEQSGARLVHAHFGLNGAFALPFVQRLQLPLAVTFHGHDVGGLLPGGRFTVRYFRYRRLAQELFDYASLLLCTSEELAVRLRELGAAADKLRVHRLGVDTTLFTPGDATEKAAQPTALMIGRMVEKKGMVYGLRAFAQARESCPEARLRIVGKGPLWRTLHNEARRLGVTGAVSFLGVQDSEQIRRELRQAHVMLTPSVTSRADDRESGVIVLKEAAATGLPAVASRHGGIPEIIDHGVTGFLASERDVPVLAKHLSALFKDSAFCARMGQAARQKMLSEYDGKKQSSKLEDLLLSMLKL